MANLRLKRRTKCIDDDREVLITQGPNGPIWTTVGENAMSGDDKAELSSKLADKRHQAAIQAVVSDIMQAAATFFEHIVLEAASDHIRDAYAEGAQQFLDWFTDSGFTFKQDGLRSIVLHRGVEMASFVAKVDPRLESEVLAALRFDQILARQVQGGNAHS